MPTQLEFLGTECPLLTCDQDSVFCACAWLTKPNDAQVALITEAKGVRPELEKMLKRQRQLGYDARYRRENREVKRAYDRERYLRKCEAERERKCMT